MDSKNVQTIKKTDSPKTTEVLIAFERPSTSRFTKLNRGDKFRALVDGCRKRRANLLYWASEQNLLEEIIRVGEPTAFNMIFAETTPHAAELLRNAPDVENVVYVKESKLELS